MDRVPQHPVDRGSASGVAFESFAAVERVRLVRLAWALVGDVDVAEDVAQDVLVEVFARWSSIVDPSAYARRALVNRLRSRWRRSARERGATARLAGRPHLPVLMPEPSAEVWRAVRRLPDRQRAALVLSVVEDRSLEDVAGILGCGVETARTHVRRARAGLASELELLEERS
jgi:RNA polymerase sigma factor (sigma-70 family)